MTKVNSRNTKTRCEICLKLTINTPDNTFIVKFEHVLTPCSSVSFINLNLEQVNAGYESSNVAFLRYWFDPSKNASAQIQQ